MEVPESKLDASPLPFLHLMEDLKHLPRTGWLRTVPHPESVAAHSWRFAIIAIFAPAALDRGKCVLLALCHDIGESVVGDIPTYAGVPKEHKHTLEHYALRYISSLVKPYSEEHAALFMNLWLEYENGTTPEANWVRQVDKFECLMQAHEYEQRTYGEEDLEEFQSLLAKISCPDLTAWLKLLQQERAAHLSKRKRRLPVIFLLCDLDITQSTFLPQGFDIEHITLDDVLREKSEDQSYPHAEFLRGSLKAEVDLPISLIIDSLEKKISEGTRWTVVSGFPNSMEQLLEFQRKVQKTNYTLLVSNSAKEEAPQNVTSLGKLCYFADEEPASGESQLKEAFSALKNLIPACRGQEMHKLAILQASIDYIRDLKATSVIPPQPWRSKAEAQGGGLKSYLKSVPGYFKEVNCDGSEGEVNMLVKEAIKNFIQHSNL